MSSKRTGRRGGQRVQRGRQAATAAGMVSSGERVAAILAPEWRARGVAVWRERLVFAQAGIADAHWLEGDPSLPVLDAAEIIDWLDVNDAWLPLRLGISDAWLPLRELMTSTDEQGILEAAGVAAALLLNLQDGPAARYERLPTAWCLLTDALATAARAQHGPVNPITVLTGWLVEHANDADGDGPEKAATLDAVAFSLGALMVRAGSVTTGLDLSDSPLADRLELAVSFAEDAEIDRALAAQDAEQTVRAIDETRADAEYHREQAGERWV